VTGRHFKASESALEGAKLALRQVLTGAEELKQVPTFSRPGDPTGWLMKKEGLVYH